MRGIRRSAVRSDEAEGIYPPERLLDLLPGTDILIVCLPLTTAASGMIGTLSFHYFPRMR